jgi:DNA-3-methyladenine glycosylase I
LASDRARATRLAKGLVRGDDGVVRCAWATSDPLYTGYHDEEWGFSVAEDRRLFEKICLEGFQSGLSWLTILRKRAGFRAAFRGFDFEALAGFGARDVTRLLKDASIVRHRGKIESTLNNARRARELAGEKGSLAAFFWSFEPAPADRPKRLTWPVLLTMSTTPASIAMSRDFKRRGWIFVGLTTVYAFMQAMGFVNDYFDGCAVRERAETVCVCFRRPRHSPPTIPSRATR